ncbi:MAG: hypothetical protein KDB63_00065 [Nocardioidaceae bacterium]|nr:hypothetical protein [Nocardioidaceae bacterium]
MTRSTAEHGRRRRAGVMLAAAVVVALGTAPPSPSTAAPAPSARAAKATLKGKVPLPPARLSGYFRPSVRVAKLTGTTELTSVTVTRKGAFSTKVAPGMYAVITSAYHANKPVQTVTVRSVKAGRTYSFRGARRAPQPIRVSVGQVAAPVGSGADASYFAKGASAMAVTDLVQSVGCHKSVGVYEDREFGRFDEVVKELKLQTTKHFPKPTRDQARQSLTNLRRYAPTHRITGSITSISAAGVSGTWTLTNLASGDVVTTIDVNAADPFGFSVTGMRGMADALCKPARFVPDQLDITFTADDLVDAGGSLHQAYGGTAHYVRTLLVVNPDGSRTALYAADTGAITGGSETLTSTVCDYGGTIPGGGTMSAGDVELQVGADGSVHYGWTGTWDGLVWTDPLTADRTPPGDPKCIPSVPGNGGSDRLVLQGRGYPLSSLFDGGTLAADATEFAAHHDPAADVLGNVPGYRTLVLGWDIVGH